MEQQATQFTSIQRIISGTLFVLVAFSFLFQNVAKQMFVSPTLFSDYQSYHFAAQTLRDGEDPYDINNLIVRAEDVDQTIANSVPPYRHSLLELLPVLPLTHLEYGDAKRIWIVIIGASVFLCVWLMMKYFLPWKASDPPSLLIGSIMLLFAPLVYSMQIHQINTVLLALLLGGLVFLRNKKILFAAVLFALAIQSKFFIGAILLALLFLKQYKVVAVSFVIAVVLFAAPFAAFPGTWGGYTTHVSSQLFGGEVIDNPLNPVQGAGTLSHFKNISLTGTATRLLTDQETVTPVLHLSSIEWLRWIGIAVFFGALVILFKTAHRIPGSREEKTVVLTTLILFIWFVFASPISWQHHLALLFIMIPWIVWRAEYIFSHKGVLWVLLLGLLGMSVIAAPPAGSQQVIRHAYALTPFIGLVLWMCAMWRVYWKTLEMKQHP